MSENIFFCYSYKLFHFLCAFGEKCNGSNVNNNTGCRYWVFNKSNRLNDIIKLYNRVKHEIVN